MKRHSQNMLIALSLTLLVVLAIISVFYVTIKTNPLWLKHCIETKLESITGHKVTIGSSSVQIFNEPNLTLVDIHIGEPDEFYVTAQKIEAVLSPWHLLFGKDHLSTVTIHQPLVSLNDSALKKLKRSAGSPRWLIMSINDGCLTYTQGDNKLILKEINGFVKPSQIDFQASLLKGQALIQARFHNGWEGRIQVHNIDLSSVRDDLSGTSSLDIRFSLTRNDASASMALDIKNLSLPWWNDHIPIPQCSCNLIAEGTMDHMAIKDISFKSPVVDIAGTGELMAVQQKRDSVLRLNMKSTEFDYEQVVRLLPTQTFSPWLETLLTKQIRGGSSRFSTIVYTGKLGELMDPRAFLKNVHIVQNLVGQSFAAGYTEDRITDVTGYVLYSDGGIAFRGLNGLINDSVIENVDLTFHDLVKHKKRTSVDVKADMPAQDFIRAWRAAMVSEKQYSLLSPVSGVKGGRLKGHVRISWDNEPDKAPQASGNISFEALDFSWRNTVVRGLSGTIQAQEFNDPLDITLSGCVNDRTMQYFHCMLSDPFGETNYTFSLKTDEPIQTDRFSLGKGSSIVIEGTGTGSDIQAETSISSNGFTLLGSSYSPKQGLLRATGTLKGKLWPVPEFTVESLSIQEPSVDVSIHATISNGTGDVSMKGSLDLARFNVLTETGEHPLTGTLSGEVNINWESSLTLSGTVLCNQAMIYTGNSPLILDGTVRITGNTLASEALTVSTGDIKTHITSGSITFTDRPHLTGVLLIEGLKLSSQESGMGKIFSSLDATAPVELVNPDLFGIPIKSIKASAELQDGVLKLSSMYIQTPSGNIQGTATLQPGEKTSFDVFVSLNNANIRQYLNPITQEEPWIRGTMNLEGHLWGNTDSVNGSLALTAIKGKIQRYALFSRIFALLNIYKIIRSHDIELTSKNFPYNMISSTFNLKDSVLSFDDFYLDSNSLQISAVGTYSLKTKELNSTLGVQPFETIDRAIGMIPLLGWILTGDDKKLIVVSMNVTGYIDDPSVQLAPIETLSNPVKNSLLRALELSSDLIKKSQELLPGEKN